MSLLLQLGWQGPSPCASPLAARRSASTPISSGFHSRAASPGSPNRLPAALRAPGSPLTLGCRCPPISPLLSLGARSPPRWEPSCPDPARSRGPGRRRSPGSSVRRRSAAPRAADAEPGEGSRSAGGSQLDYARASLRPRRRRAASRGQPNRNCFGGRGAIGEGAGPKPEGSGGGGNQEGVRAHASGPSIGSQGWKSSYGVAD